MLLYEIFGDGVVVIVGVGFGEVVMVVFEVIVVLFLDVFVVDFFVVEFVVGDGVVEGGIGLGVGVGLEVLMVLDVGFFVGNVIGFVWVWGGEFNFLVFCFVLFVLDKRFIRILVKVLFFL